jgi:two-component system, sensor histidine kinase and response regulator
MRILLAEDNIVNQRIARAILERAGHVVSIAGSGTAAVAAVESSVFDLVLMDVEMPEMSGTDATAAIRRRERVHGGHMPIIALTAHAMKGDRERCLDAGADGYVPKPIVRGDLFGEIETVLASNGHPMRTPETGVIGTREQLLEFVDGYEPLLDELIDLFLQDAPRVMNTIRQALTDRDANALYAAAHTLKGSAANFLGEKTTLACERMEVRAKEGDFATAAQVCTTIEAELDRMMNALAATRKAAVVRCAS